MHGPKRGVDHPVGSRPDDGADLAAASALFGVMWGAGAALGPQLGGVAYDYLPVLGIPLTIALLSALLLPLPVAAWLRRRREDSRRAEY